MKASIIKQRLDQEFYTAERCFITEISNSPEDAALSIARARVEPGVTTCWHLLKTSTERYSIISGSGIVEIGDLPPQPVTAGDVAIIPPMCRQRITNMGSDDLVFLALCTPRFRVDDYQDLEVAVV